MIVKIIQALNQPEKYRQMQITSKPDRNGQLKLVKPAPKWIIDIMSGRPSTYFNANLLPGGELKIYCETKPFKTW